MPKSAKDELIARIDADLAQVHAVANYVGSDGSSALSARIDADVARLASMRDYVTAQVPKAAATEPKKRGRKPKRGLPDTPSNGD